MEGKIGWIASVGDAFIVKKRLMNYNVSKEES